MRGSYLLKLRTQQNHMNFDTSHRRNVGQRVRNVRRSLGLSGEEFAKSIGTTKQAVSLIENGKRAPSLAMLNEIVTQHSIDARYLHGQINEIRIVRDTHPAVAVPADEFLPSHPEAAGRSYASGERDGTGHDGDRSDPTEQPKTDRASRDDQDTELDRRRDDGAGRETLSSEKHHLLLQVLSFALQLRTEQLHSIVAQMWRLYRRNSR